MKQIQGERRTVKELATGELKDDEVLEERLGDEHIQVALDRSSRKDPGTFGRKRDVIEERGKNVVGPRDKNVVGPTVWSRRERT
jgi:hypothetical protein